ncbi:PREDICTED: IQ and AAA domain-containing protein 1 [Ceratosolen solmsi marchali]|uniref:IQ and AAA domain-containing protein 1 n=1 Tax=Ceratosolen solmsi marchali TaxID=326594 RepID=A0AAJ6YJ27_9HYME|nr:PREDICTED: IQ and AAA domain-containing protein 1 [Ceratosolen solmsi marchali]
MTNASYDAMWCEAHVSLEEVTQLDSLAQSSSSVRERDEARSQVVYLYVRYIDLSNRLEQCYDQIVQPQKRSLLRRLLESTYGRVLELKHELVELELDEYNYFDDALLKENMTPDELELRVPRYFRRERESEIANRRKFIEETLRNMGGFEDKSEKKKMTELEAIRLIQSYERARQGRIRFQFMKEILEMKEKSTIRSELKKPDVVTATAAALKIQKIWRGYSTRRKVSQRKLDEMLLIGMLQPYQISFTSTKQLEQIEKKRYEKQKEFQDMLDAYIVEVKDRIKTERGAIIEETIRNEIRNWINTCYQQTGKIPELPSAENGGSRIIFSRQDTESSMSKSTGVSSSKESKRSKKSSKTKKESETEQQSESDITGFKFMPSNFLNELIQANQEYQEIWKDKDESSNLDQRPYFDMVEAEKTQEVENEIRINVDQALRIDIEALQSALDRDKGCKGKRAKKAQKRVRRSGKKNKKKKDKDLTPDRSTGSLFEELLHQGIIKLCPEVYIDNFKGEKSYSNFHLRQKGKSTLPAIGDIRQIIKEYCILPMGSETLRELTPLVRSVLIAGPRGSGKKMLVHAICTELGATLFDITPSNIVGKYPGKTGLIMLLHLISKVSKLLQPSVIFMEGAERPFVKKVPKADKTDPKRLKKDLPKLVKNITNEDRVILIGTSSSPWNGDQKLLYQTYDKVIFIPRPDYGSMSLIWKDLLYKYSGINRQFNTSGMAKLCDGFTIGTVLSTIDSVMTTKRMVQLRVQPLTHIELINALSLKNPIYREEEDAFLNWYYKTPTCKRKQKAIELELAKLEEENEKKKKGKK